jgi:hypothetical protein
LAEGVEARNGECEEIFGERVEVERGEAANPKVTVSNV